jgi:hypothetical protein
MTEYHDVYLGRVAHTRSTDAWVQLQVPQVLGTALTAWARPMGFNDLTTEPPVGTLVLVQFIGADLNHPCYSLTSKEVG